MFNTYKINDKVDEVLNAIKILALQGYTILDFEGNVINKWNFNKNKKLNINYNRVPKLKK
tara:strand:+ start:1275 stop:1454 length:180 start_codon:yes stop_codon:yes gene_type:complete